jgi:ectoine hydroxylase-related dioxygenase (phytanoyl-CoA dioxygenase family)
MSSSLTPDQVASYWTDGFLTPLDAIPADHAADLLRRLESLEAQELAARGGTWPKRDYRPWEMEDHPLRAWMDEIARLPTVLDAIEGVLGPDILLRNADIFLKEPQRRQGIGWHWDTAERGDDADQILTAWLALTPATPANGCLRYARASHRTEVPDAPKDKYHLTFSKEACASIPPESVVYNELSPGQMSLHHFRVAHASGPNTTAHRRIGVALRVMSPRVTAATAESGQATLLRGRDTLRHFAIKDRFPMTWTF